MNAPLLLDSLIPGYSLISRLLLDLFGLDAARLLPSLGFCFGLYKAGEYAFYTWRGLFLQFFACSVTLPSDTEACYSMQTWLADKKNFAERASNLIAINVPRYVDPIRMPHHPPGRGSAIPTKKKKAPQLYEPVLDSFQYFWYQGRPFVWYKSREPRGDGRPGQIEAKLFCFGLTTQPIKALLEDAGSYYDGKQAGMTTVWRPAPKNLRNMGGNEWRTVATRPSRPLSTVLLDERIKKDLIADVESYLQPESRKWYAQRGIPYRRGYLFHGPPGTGKTSLSFALAGYLDLRIYCVSLSEQSITEEDLFTLFSQLPEQCVVLLEDIDSAGLKKRDIKGVPKPGNTDVSVEQQPKPDPVPLADQTQVSLSGLLNVIDGVASHEGRLLIMTTNVVSALDKALLRPGRIDFKIKFGMATKTHAHDLFVQTFMNYAGNSIDEKAAIPPSLAQNAERFSKEIPEESFTPADIQGYLLAWKNGSPEDAVDNVKAWVNGERNDDE